MISSFSKALPETSHPLHTGPDERCLPLITEVMSALLSGGRWRLWVATACWPALVMDCEPTKGTRRDPVHLGN